MFHIFDTLIMPMVTFGSDVWGNNKNAHTMSDKVFLRFIRCTLGVKCTTSNILVFVECGLMPPSTKCTINSVCFMNRLMHMGGDSLAFFFLNWKILPNKVLMHGSVHCVKRLMLCSLTCSCILLNFVKNVKLSCDKIYPKKGSRYSWYK